MVDEIDELVGTTTGEQTGVTIDERVFE